MCYNDSMCSITIKFRLWLRIIIKTESENKHIHLFHNIFRNYISYTKYKTLLSYITLNNFSINLVSSDIFEEKKNSKTIYHIFLFHAYGFIVWTDTTKMLWLCMIVKSKKEYQAMCNIFIDCIMHFNFK